MKPRRSWSRRRSLTCQQAVALVTDYLDDALAYDERVRFEAHLEACPNCAEHLKQIRVTIRLTGEVSVDDLDPLVRADLMDLYRRWRSDPSRHAEPRDRTTGES